MPERRTGHKATPTQKLKKENRESAPSTLERVAQARKQPEMGDAVLPSPLEKAVSELQGLHKLLLSDDLDPHVLTSFRDALSRVRTAAWAAQQYISRKDMDDGPSSVLSFMAGERIRATYQLCQSLNDDLKRTDIDFQPGSLVQLHEVAKALTAQLDSVINRRG